MDPQPRHALEIAVVAEQTACTSIKLHERPLLQKINTLRQALLVAYTDREALRGTHFSDEFLYAKRQLTIRINQLTREHLLYTAQYYELHCTVLAAELHTVRIRQALSTDASARHFRGQRSCPTCGRAPQA
jgi:hypothetical protein